jgi:hypothetical protein
MITTSKQIIQNLISKIRGGDASFAGCELIVAFECTGEQESFAEVIKQLIGINFRAECRDNAYYLLPHELPPDKIIRLAGDIESEFNKYREHFSTEGYSDDGSTSITFILLSGKKMEMKEIICYPARKRKKS